MVRNGVDLVLLVVVLIGGVFAWRTGAERARLAAHHARLVAATGELPVDDPTLIYVKALDTGDPLHFAWRVHLPANTNLEVRTGRGGGNSGGVWWSSKPTDFIARVRIREDAQGVVNIYSRWANSSTRSGDSEPGLVRLLREHARELEVEQAGKPGVATLDPKATKPALLLKVAPPRSLQDRPPPDLPKRYLPRLVEVWVGPKGSFP